MVEDGSHYSLGIKVLSHSQPACNSYIHEGPMQLCRVVVRLLGRDFLRLPIVPRYVCR